MRCPCADTLTPGRIVVRPAPADRPDAPIVAEPCHLCGGTLVAHCCEGERAQPQTHKETH